PLREGRRAGPRGGRATTARAGTGPPVGLGRSALRWVGPLRAGQSRRGRLLSSLAAPLPAEARGARSGGVGSPARPRSAAADRGRAALANARSGAEDAAEPARGGPGAAAGRARADAAEPLAAPGHCRRA